MAYREPLASIAQSIRTAQQIAHRRLYELGDESHAGEPLARMRPVCVRLLADAEDIDDWDRDQ